MMCSILCMYVFFWLGVLWFVMIFFFFFFQAEDGIRDLVRSRGLGDVYKRQSQYNLRPWHMFKGVIEGYTEIMSGRTDNGLKVFPVSYTHLTLPTIYSV